MVKCRFDGTTICEVNNFGWCMYYNKSVDEITKCGKGTKWMWGYPDE